MVTCPNCKTENRSGARFCTNCATSLSDAPISTYSPVNDLADNQSTNPPKQASNPLTSTRRLGDTQRTNTKPLTAKRVFLQRPPGAIFGDHYLFQRFLSSDNQRIQYQVDLLDSDDEIQIYACPNPECGAVFPPRNMTPEVYCTDCGTKLVRAGKDLILYEFINPLAGNVIRTAAKGLSHGSVRAPLATFVEKLGSQVRNILVAPYVEEFKISPSSINPTKMMVWGSSLGRGLDYLHDNGIHFGGKIDISCFGMVDGRPVWSNFEGVNHHPEGFVSDRYQDTQALAHMLLSWLTGKEDGQTDPMIPPALKQTFDDVFLQTTVLNGKEFARRLDKVSGEPAQPLEVDLFSGHRSDVGMVRDLNEDSIMTLEMVRNQQSTIHSIGLYLVADGMGGHAGGEVASGQIVELFSRKAFENLMPSLIGELDRDLPGWLRATVEAANRQVFNLRKTAGTDMGSTLVAAAMVGNHAYITHIGDSRAYMVNQDEIRRITVDHSLVERMIASHQITREEARHHPQRNVIYRTIGDKPNIEVEIQRQILEVDEYLLLCSDGLSGLVNDDSMQRIILSAATPQEACDNLVKAANAGGGDDNISVILVKVVVP